MVKRVEANFWKEFLQARAYSNGLVSRGGIDAKQLNINGSPVGVFTTVRVRKAIKELFNVLCVKTNADNAWLWLIYGNRILLF